MKYSFAPVLVLALVSACGSDDKGTPSAEPDVSLHTYAASDPNIEYAGRIDAGNADKPKFSAPGVYETVRFKGTGISARILDEFSNTVGNFFDVIVDGGEPSKLTTKVDLSPPVYSLASDLPNAEHEVTVIKRTEASVGFAWFQGFEINGEILPPAQQPKHKIEIIGDSISCGAGIEALNDSAQCSEGGWGVPYNNVDKAYGPLLSRALDAEFHVTAVSGIGLIRNYSALYDARPMPEVYSALFLQQKGGKAFDTSSWLPDALLLALGTNDFSPGDGMDAVPREIMTVDTFAAAYITFIDTLKGLYPNAQVFVLSSPMLGDGWPTVEYQSATNHKAAITAVADHYASLGDKTVHKFFVTKVDGHGCGTHPDVKQQAHTAEELEPFVRETMAW